MTDDEREAAMAERFQQWGHELKSVGALPLFLVGTRPDGTAQVCIPRGMPFGVIINTVEQLLDLLKKANHA